MRALGLAAIDGDSTQLAEKLIAQHSLHAEDILRTARHAPGQATQDASRFARIQGGELDQVDDVAIWRWSPILHDAFNDLLGHNASELDRYPGATILDISPGSSTYGSILARDIVPITWDLAAGETWTFEFPTGDVVHYDPNLTLLGADPED